MLGKIQSSSTMALLLSPLGVLIIAATRLLIVSDYNMSTALAILSSDGYVNTLLGTVFPLIPVLLPYLALVLLYLNRVIASCLAFIATLLVSPATMTRAGVRSTVLREWHMIVGGGSGRHALLLLLAIPAGALLLATLAGFGPAVVVRTIGTIAIIMVLPLMVQLYHVPLNEGFYADLLRQPWLPAESITLTTHETVVAYQLESDGYWLEVLMDQSRSVEHYRMSQISARDICQIASISTGRPLLPLVSASAPPEPCYPAQPSKRSIPGSVPVQMRNNLIGK